MKKWSLILLILIICGAAAQLIRPQIGNPPVTADISAPPEVEQVLKRACYDCHSNETKLTWFDRITPADFLVAGHIRMGRKVLNFSHWDSLTRDQRLGKLYESLNQATFGVMPLSDYTRFHPAARISDQDLEVFKNYLLSITPVIHPDSANSAKEAAADAQYAKWIGTAARSILPAPNGIAFPAGFENWEAISTSERFDNGTMRVIFGNDIAVKAIKEQHTNPWPDGTVFAKAAWDQVTDSTGAIHPGAFKQVEFMIRDKTKYAGTDGWGFARWVKGTDLVPYGKTALFATECTNCHKPMQNNDFVFTLPIQPTEGRVITSGIDRQSKTMFTLYGNDLAAAAARTGQPYPAGAGLYLVTWAQRPDPHWFGANIPDPDKKLSVEKVTFTANAAGKVQPVYEGSGTTSQAASGAANRRLASQTGAASPRLASLLSQRVSVLP